MGDGRRSFLLQPVSDTWSATRDCLPSEYGDCTEVQDYPCSCWSQIGLPLSLAFGYVFYTLFERPLLRTRKPRVDLEVPDTNRRSARVQQQVCHDVCHRFRSGGRGGGMQALLAARCCRDHAGCRADDRAPSRGACRDDVRRCQRRGCLDRRADPRTQGRTDRERNGHSRSSGSMARTFRIAIWVRAT